MIKTIITMVVTAIAGLIGYLVSDSFRERLAQRQRDKIAEEVARGDEAAVNARIGRFRAVGPWVLLALVVVVGCAVTRTCYVREQDKVTAISPTFHVRKQNPSGCWSFACRSSLHSRFRRVGSFA